MLHSSLIKCYFLSFPRLPIKRAQNSLFKVKQRSGQHLYAPCTSVESLWSLVVPLDLGGGVLFHSYRFNRERQHDRAALSTEVKPLWQWQNYQNLFDSAGVCCVGIWKTEDWTHELNIILNEEQSRGRETWICWSSIFGQSVIIRCEIICSVDHILCNVCNWVMMWLRARDLNHLVSNKK